MMQLDDFKVPGKNLVVKGNLEFRTEDIAGETSGTDAVEKGTKPKILRVSLQIPFTMAKDLGGLIKTAETMSEAGARKIWAITHPTANAVGIRQVQFAESVNWEEAGGLQLWKISFTLRECLSNPERVETRAPAKEPVEQAATGTTLRPSMRNGRESDSYDGILENAEALK
ncbi:hypothetical protein [Desulfoluna sp.]|uniref:baseplate complex protein n=1 Tax=Desulfoluna sp. TaxID=2045199 RepID=UPI00260388F0|nr:hypothetical protein [Desulfoluna sp.]